MASAVLAAGLAVWTVPAAAQQTSVLDRLSEDYSADVVLGVQEVLQQAGELGLPEQAMADKALEGAAKHVPGDRLLEALQRRLDGLQTAADALPADAGPASVRAGADALQQGLSPEDVGRIGEIAPEADRPAALVVLGELARLGVPVGQAEEKVAQALDGGGGAGSVLALGQQVRAGVLAGESPLSALSQAGIGPFGDGFPGRAPMGGPFGTAGVPGPPVPPGAGPPGGIPGGGPPGDGPPDEVPGPPSS